MPFSTTIDNAILDTFTGKQASWAKPTAVYAALSSTTPTKAGGNVTEHGIGSDGYQRVQIATADFDSAASSATTTNTDKSFPQATGDWLSGANMTYIVFYDASTAGTFLGYTAITTPKPVLSGDTAKILAGELDLTIS